MNAGIYPPATRYATPPRAIGGAPARAVQAPAGIDNTLDWRKSTPQRWPRIADSMHETIRVSDWRPTYAVMPPTFPGGTNLLIGGVLFDGGRKVYLTPFNATTATIYDAVNDTISTPPGSYGGSAGFLAGVLLATGDIFICPRSSTTARIYSPATGQVRTPGGTFPGGSSTLTAGVAFDNGTQVYCLPNNSTSARIWDSRTETVRTPTGTFGGSASTSAGCLLPDGRILIVPQADTVLRIYDWQRDAMFTSGVSLSSTYFGGTLMPNGDEVWLTPYSSTSGLLYNWRRDTARVTSGTWPGSLAYFSSVMAPDGSLVAIPAAATASRQYQPRTDTLTVLAGTYSGSNDGGGGCLLSDGRVMIFPRGMTTARSYGAKGTPSLDENVTLSPFVNRR